MYCESGELLSSIPLHEKIPILVWGHMIFTVSFTLTDQLHATVRIYANVCTSCTFVVTVNKTNC